MSVVQAGAGTPDEAARGARRLLDLGCDVSISLVLCRQNVDSVADTVRFIRARVGRVAVVVSVARHQYGLDRPWDETLLRYREAAPGFVEALETGAAEGLEMRSSGTCAFPPCVLPTPARERHGRTLALPAKRFEWHEVRAGLGDADSEHRNVYAERCWICAARPRCPGVQRAYLERFGDAELAPLASLAELGMPPPR